MSLSLRKKSFKGFYLIPIINSGRGVVDNFYEDFCSIDQFWRNLVDMELEGKIVRVKCFHFCLSYHDLITLCNLLRKKEELPQIITKNINYLGSYIKKEVVSKTKEKELEEIFFLVNVKNHQVNSSLLKGNVCEEDDLKSFMINLLLSEDDSEFLEILEKPSDEAEDTKRKHLLVHISSFSVGKNSFRLKSMKNSLKKSPKPKIILKSHSELM